jgi:hypothetical protein
MRVTMMMGLYGVEDCIKEWCEKVCVREEEVCEIRRGGERGEEWGRVVEAWFMQAEKCCPSDASRVELGGWARVCA